MTAQYRSDPLPAIRFQLGLLRLGGFIERLREDGPDSQAEVDAATMAMDQLREFAER